MGARPPHTRRRPLRVPLSRHADQGGDLLTMQLAELGQVGEQGPADDGANPGDGPEEILLGAPNRTRLNRVGEVAIDVDDAAFEPADVLRQAPTDRRGRVFEAIALGRQHVQELSAAGHERVELLPRRIRERPRRGMHPLGKEGQEVRIEGVGFGELAGRFREITHLARIGDDERQPTSGQRGHQRRLVPARGLQDDQDGSHRLDAVPRHRSRRSTTRRRADRRPQSRLWRHRSRRRLGWTSWRPSRGGIRRGPALRMRGETPRNCAGSRRSAGDAQAAARPPRPQAGRAVAGQGTIYAVDRPERRYKAVAGEP
jgi:hypothetical protein